MRAPRRSSYGESMGAPKKMMSIREESTEREAEMERKPVNWIPRDRHRDGRLLRGREEREASSAPRLLLRRLLLL
jgi:hypothetical protein